MWGDLCPSPTTHTIATNTKQGGHADTQEVHTASRPGRCSPRDGPRVKIPFQGQICEGLEKVIFEPPIFWHILQETPPLFCICLKTELL